MALSYSNLDSATYPFDADFYQQLSAQQDTATSPDDDVALNSSSIQDKDVTQGSDQIQQKSMLSGVGGFICGLIAICDIIRDLKDMGENLAASAKTNKELKKMISDATKLVDIRT